MTIDPRGEAYLNERLANAYMLPVADLAVGRRFAEDRLHVHRAVTPARWWLATPGVARRFPRGSTHPIPVAGAVTADALVPIERLEPWESFGPNGRRVVDIIERLYRFDPDDLRRVRRRLGDARRRPIAPSQDPSAIRHASRVAGDRDPGVGPLGRRAIGARKPSSIVEWWENGYQGDPRRLLNHRCGRAS